MITYSEKEVLQLGKRINNPKRSYLLVNPLQGKHIPVSPAKTYQLSAALGEKLYLEASDAKIIIGFAETATAIGALAALQFPEDVIYLHTTREKLISDQTVSFSEEHSHAVDQQIDCTAISQNSTATIVLIDDEISTGKTIHNIIRQLRTKFDFLRTVRFVVGSVINRMSEEVIKEMQMQNIHFVSLVKITDRNFEKEVAFLSVTMPEPYCSDHSGRYEAIQLKHRLPDLRKGSSIRSLKKDMRLFCEEITMQLKEKLSESSRILFLGTEECMMPAIVAGQEFEKLYGKKVMTHSTTRSPIGINTHSGYPCKNGWSIYSFYEMGRKNYLYNLDYYNAAVVITDSHDLEQICRGMQQLSDMLQKYCKKIYLIRG